MEGGMVCLLDQSLLPFEEKVIRCSNVEEVADAISSMKVRGAPAIGVAAAFGMSLAHSAGMELSKAASLLRSTRPTAVNLEWAVDRVLNSPDPVSEAGKIEKEDLEANRLISEHGSSLIRDGDSILTHCNAGFLATAGEYGTALGVLKFAHQQGKRIHVYFDETRPRLQGARLTAWELSKENISHTLICDDMAAYLMFRKKIDKVLVGADRILASTGSVVNKIGTYSLAVLAKYHSIPLYVAAPSTTIDSKLSSDSGIQIEERSLDEVLKINGAPISLTGSAVNPSFDITPSSLVTSVITEKGVFNPNAL